VFLISALDKHYLLSTDSTIDDGSWIDRAALNLSMEHD